MFCHLLKTYNNDYTKKKENIIKYSIYKFLYYLCSHIGTKFLYSNIKYQQSIVEIEGENIYYQI